MVGFLALSMDMCSARNHQLVVTAAFVTEAELDSIRQDPDQLATTYHFEARWIQLEALSL